MAMPARFYVYGQLDSSGSRESFVLTIFLVGMCTASGVVFPYDRER